jgi:SulP family sulfate permease
MAFNGLSKNDATALAAFFVSGPRDVFAGLVSSIVSIAYGLSFAALIFAPPLTPWIAYGIAATFLTLAVSTAIVALRSSLPFAIAGPDPTTVAVTATLVGALIARLSAEGVPDDLLAPVVIIMGLAAALTGLLLCGLGLARAGGAIRFIPYPVIGGFLGATGCLMVSGAVRVITGYGLGPSTADALLALPMLAKLAPAIAIAVAIYLSVRRFGENPFALPVILIAGIAAAHLAFTFSGISLADGVREGWLFKAPASLGLTPTWDFEDLKIFPWQVLPSLAADIFAVMFVTAISSLLNTTGLEFLTRREANLGRELNTIGIANIAAAALGGYGSTIALNRTTLNYLAGARGRLSGLTVAAVSALVLFVDPGFITYVPKFVLGGLLLYLGGLLVYEWLIDSARRISVLEYASLLAIALLILQIGFIAGVLIGVIIGCATFAVSASRVNAIKFSFDGSEYRSSLDRGPEELKILAEHGAEIQGMSLQSYLFFGSANRLYEQVKALFAKAPGTKFLIFDFRLVTGIDSSAIHSFTQIKRAADEAGARLVLVNVSPELGAAFRNRQFTQHDVILADDLDRALEACEEAVIAAHSGAGADARTLREWFTQALGNAAYGEQLAAACERLEVRAGEIIASQGDPPDCMHFILEGRVGIIVKLDDGREVRVRSLGPHTTTGEMGLITRQLRSATVQAEIDSLLYALSVEAYERLKRDNPPLHQALLTYVVTVMAERLGFASKVIGVLRR